ncbi:hypothetical protein [Nocardioides abyssi]|uniref:Transcriptional regulator, AbiEi antitoxin, Type IV TA system n=1 Tax=Nocardioides abyssi TaxID=3058370 RepID=A0ABT8EVX0_9ACTN|nr:hypothetical protein [Nocardioides abyssi]MDN4162116.1 hypothetical protein [Nocardioides abyssi]
MQKPIELRPPEDPRNGPVLLRQQLLAAGYNDNAIARMKRGGVIRPLRGGAYVAAEVWERLDEVGRYGLRCRAVLGQAKAPVVLSHVSALPEYDAPTWGFDLVDVHVTRTDGIRGRRARGVQQHVGTLRPADLVRVNGVPAVTPARAALDTVMLGCSEASLVVMNDLTHRGLASEAELREQYVEMQTWPGMSAAEVLLRLVDPRIESVGESRTFWALYQQRLPRPVSQYEVKDSAGRVIARLDFAWPELGVWLEFDGREKYEKHRRPGESVADAVVREKNREDLVRRVTGWRCIRITWADLADPRRLAAIIHRVLFPAA